MRRRRIWRFLGLLDVHAFDEAIPDSISVMDQGVDEQISFKIADRLVNLDDESASGIWFNMERLYMRIDRRPLASPVIAHRIYPIDVPTFHAVRPFDIRMHAREYSVHMACVEVLVDLCQ